MIALPLLLVALVAAIPATADAGLTPEGTWVTAATRRLVQSGEGGDPGCYLIVSEEGRVVEEHCSEVPTRWPSVTVRQSGRSIEIRSEGPEVGRRLVLRPGAPSEVEVMVERGGERSFHRLYRLDERSLPALRSLALFRDRLMGAWETEDGVPFRLEPDGGYVFGGDLGRFRVEGGFGTEGGAWGALFLDPEVGGPVRRYLLHGRGNRIGLAEVPHDVDLLLPSLLAESDEAPETEAPETEEVEAVVVEGIAIPLPSGAPPPADILPPGVMEPTPRLWLERAALAEPEGAGTEVEEAIAEKEAPAEAEVPAIAQPIRPARSCGGCGAAEAGLGLGLLLPWLWFARRRV